MARFAAGLLTGMAIMTIAGAALGIRASSSDQDVHEAAVAAGVDEQDLKGALVSLALAGKDVDPYGYLRSDGKLPSLPPSAAASPPAPTSGVSSRVACIIKVESKGDPRAYNRSGASGLGQFLPSTWATTPQGRAGLSVWDPVANRAAIEWMLAVGRAREFDAVRFYGC